MDEHVIDTTIDFLAWYVTTERLERFQFSTDPNTREPMHALMLKHLKNTNVIAYFDAFTGVYSPLIWLFVSILFAYKKIVSQFTRNRSRFHRVASIYLSVLATIGLALYGNMLVARIIVNYEQSPFTNYEQMIEAIAHGDMTLGMF